MAPFAVENRDSNRVAAVDRKVCGFPLQVTPKVSYVLPQAPLPAALELYIALVEKQGENTRQ